MDSQRRSVFVTGGTGYVGRPVILRLLERAHEVRALVRPGSEKKLPAGCQVVFGNALDSNTYTGQIKPSDTFVPTGRSFASQSIESSGIPQCGLGFWPGRN